ncbi:polysaccharide biosynthesis/export family protein [Alsobacter sp. KACC 23698]|uniref:Polysaccharide biosynthesis/export family protein n=1 Tax=Alsobacter sp. KACC 23698 TaxID=3149229 RepID=A0AAU7JIZ6_9HYPH
MNPNQQLSKARMLRICAAIPVLFMVFGACAAAEYKIGPQDKLKIKVYDWPALSDEVTVGDDGMIMLPLLGAVTAESASRRDLAKTIAQMLQAHERLPALPYVSVDVAQYRPFYVLGHVQHPGEYAFRPGLTPMMALSVAGGVYRATENLRLERDMIQGQGALKVLNAKKWSLIFKIARLKSELAGKTEVVIEDEPIRLAANARHQAMLGQETAILQTRRKALANEIDGLRRRIGGYKEEIDLLVARMNSLVRQQKSVEVETQAMNVLGAKGLTILPRQASLERLAAQIEGDQRQVDTLSSEAKQNILQTEIAIAKLTDEREREIMAELKAASAELAETDHMIATQTDLVREAEILGSTKLTRSGAPESRLRFRVLRRTSESQSEEFELTRDASVEPGDVLTVELPESEESEAPAVPQSAPLRQGAVVTR